MAIDTSNFHSKVAFIAPTCFYYQVHLFRALAAHPRVDLMVYFCSDEGLLGYDILKAYGADASWDVEQELVQGGTSPSCCETTPRSRPTSIL